VIFFRRIIFIVAVITISVSVTIAISITVPVSISVIVSISQSSGYFDVVDQKVDVFKFFVPVEIVDQFQHVFG
jgi:hypothetical protein